MRQDGHKRAKTGPRKALNAPKMGPRWAHDRRRWPKTGRRLLKLGLRSGQYGPRSGQDRPRWAQDRRRWPNIGLTSRKMAWTYVGPLFCGSERDGRWSGRTLDPYFAGPNATEEPKVSYFAKWKRSGRMWSLESGDSVSSRRARNFFLSKFDWNKNLLFSIVYNKNSNEIKGF